MSVIYLVARKSHVRNKFHASRCELERTIWIVGSDSSQTSSLEELECVQLVVEEELAGGGSACTRVGGEPAFGSFNEDSLYSRVNFSKIPRMLEKFNE